MPPAAIDALARRFVAFAEESRENGSPTYERLSYAVAYDPVVLALAATAKNGPIPNLFFAAAHALLIADAEEKRAGSALAKHYARAAEGLPLSEDLAPAFRAYCIERDAEIREILASRLVQTSVVRRCAYLAPALRLVARIGGDRPLAVVDVGAATGLNLLWDRYRYDYGNGPVFGDSGSPVVIRTMLRGDSTPPSPVPFPSVVRRIGIDLNPLDVRRPEDVRWLRALVWPEHRDSADLLAAAVEAARRDPPEMIAGDALAVLPGVLNALPFDATPVVVHCHTLNQFPLEAKDRFTDIIASAARERTVWRVSSENGALDLIAYGPDGRTERRLANVHGHARWIEWVDRESTSSRVPRKFEDLWAW